jgi:hypothetical protein
MQHIYCCPVCKSKIAFGSKLCVDCGTPFDWQQFKPPAYSTQPPQYQQQVPPQYQQQHYGHEEQYNCQQPKKRGMTIGLIVLFCFAGLIILGGIIWSLSGGGSASSSTKPSPVTITITAIQLWVDFDSDQDAANAKYRGKVINVTGIVNEIGIDRVDTPYVLLTSADGLFGVQCLFSSKDELRLAQLSAGQSLTIQGICQGYDLDVVLKNCSIK